MKVVVFFKRIVKLNETFAPIGGSMKIWKEKATHVLWHQTIKGRSAPVVANTCVKFIRESRDIIHFIFWLDNCLGQNKNWLLYTALANEVSSENSSAKNHHFEVFRTWSYVYVSR